MRDGRCRDQASGASLVLNDERLAQLFLQMLADKPGGGVGHASRRKGNDNSDGSCRIALGHRRSCNRTRDEARGNCGPQHLHRHVPARPHRLLPDLR